MIVTNATFEKNVDYGRIKVGSADLNVQDLTADVTLSLQRLKLLEAELDRILPTFTLNATLPADVELIGDLLVNGTLYAKRVTIGAMNSARTSIVNTDDVVIHGRKSFPSIDTNNFTILTTLNGVPLEEIAFDASLRDYGNVDFTRLKRLEVRGHLNFSEINNVNWRDLMRGIVWKDKQAVISGEITVDEVRMIFSSFFIHIFK